MMVYLMMCAICYCVKYNIILKEDNEIVQILKFDCFCRLRSIKNVLRQSEGYVIFSI